MSDTNCDSDDSVVFVGVSENIKLQDVHPKPETSPYITIVPETPDCKRMKILPNNGEPSSIEYTQGKYQNIYNNKIYIYTYQKKTVYLITTTFSYLKNP